ncbi:hypothetical protein FACS189479_09820 [Spirochaetia bacterium]|nr:hypothetical protein FACS189479_09820 [Spirochaetia bacterium]
MSEASEIRELQNACIALSPPNKQQAYDVASALKFAEDRALTAAGVSRTGDGDEAGVRPNGTEQRL